MQAGRYHVPQPEAGRTLCPTDRSRQHPTIDGVTLKRLLPFALGLHQAVPLPQGFGLPPLPREYYQTHLPQEPVQVFFADLHRTEGPVPLPALAGTAHGLHVLDHHHRERQDGLQLLDHPRFGLPSAARRGRNAVLALDAIVEPFGASPLAMPSRPAHGATHFDRLFHVVGCFRHEGEHRVFCPHHAVALELGAGVNARHQRLVVRFLFVREVHVEETELVALWSRLSALEKVTRFGGRAGH